MIHQGTCDALGDSVYTLSNIADGKSRTTVETSFDQLRVSGYAIALYASPEKLEEPLACGNIEG